MTEWEMVTFNDLSPWLKLAVVWALVHVGLTFLMLIIYAIIGIAHLG